MKKKIISGEFAEFWSIYKKDALGIIGLCILLICTAIIIFEPVLSKYPLTSHKWNNMEYWEDNPVNAPPAWTNLFSKKKSASSATIKNFVKTETMIGDKKAVTYTFTYNYKYDKAPRDVIVKTASKGSYLVNFKVTRPDSRVIDLIDTNFNSDNMRFSVQNDAKNKANDFVRQNKFDSIQNIQMYLTSGIVDPSEIIFMAAKKNMLIERPALKGKYVFEASFVPQSEGASLDSIYLVLPGKVYGIFGTDNQKHDIWAGIVAGMKWAFVIGFSIAITTVLIGVLYAIIMAYFGGWVDSAMNFIFEYFVSIPLIPLVIVLGAIFKISLPLLIGIMIMFSWTGPVKTVRSMALQLKEETYIEAARALGASNWRIIFKHMFPNLILYSFSMMALAAPGAILTETGFSMLGLGDPTLCTFGRILNSAGAGAAANGLWWQVIPPGLAIGVIGMAFAFIGFSLDKILQPKLRTR